MMMGLHPAQQRLHQTETGRTAWVTFPTKGGGFGPLEGFEEIVLEPRCDNRPLPHHEGDTLTYVHEGAVAYANSRGESGVMRAGELRRMTGVAQSQQLEANASDSDSAQLFRMKLADNRRAVEPRDEQRRFGIANQRVGLCVIASHDGRNGSLRLQQEALVFSAVLSAGQHVVHEVALTRQAWLHVVAGEIRLGDDWLRAGDGWGFLAAQRVSLLGGMGAEILLLDLPGVEVGR